MRYSGHVYTAVDDTIGGNQFVDGADTAQCGLNSKLFKTNLSYRQGYVLSISIIPPTDIFSVPTNFKNILMIPMENVYPWI